MGRPPDGPRELVRDACRAARAQLKRFAVAGRAVSRNDIRGMVMAQTIVKLSRLPGAEAALELFALVELYVEEMIDRLHGTQPT